MASSFSTDLKIELMVTGENAGTWGDNTNDNLAVVEQAIAGFESISIAGGAQTTTLAIANSPDIVNSKARNVVIKLTGVITGNQIVTIPTGITKTYIVENGTTGAFTVEFKQAGGTGTTFSATDKAIKILFADGTNINPVDLNTLSGDVATAQIENLAVTSAKLASFAVTSVRLASFAVTAVKIAQSTITQSKLATGSVGADQLIATAVTPATYTSATITVDADGRITAASSGSAGAGGYDLNKVITGPSTSDYTKTPGTNRAHFFLYGAGGGGTSGNAGSTSPGGGNPGTTGARGGFGFVPGYPLANSNTVGYALGAGGTAPGGTGGASRLGPSPAPIITANAAAGGTQGNASVNPGPSGQSFSPNSGFYNGIQPWGAGGGGGAGGNWTSPEGGSPNPGSPGSAGSAGVLVVWENTGT